MVALGRGQSEKIHLDLHDDNQVYTIILNCGRQSQPWNRTKQQGSLNLPTLGCSIPMNIGDVVLAETACLPHFVTKLDECDINKRLVITAFTCANLAAHIGHPPNIFLPYKPLV